MRFLFTLASTLISAVTIAQNTITGTVTDTQNLPLPYSSIILKSDTSDQLIDGTISDLTGNFSITMQDTSVYLEISFTGFETQKITTLNFNNPEIDLDTIRLEESTETLKEAVIETEKSQVQFKLDKRVFNVGQDLSSQGASALEVLNHVPSVDVDIEGEISLRGNQGVQILINGKPSVLTSSEGNALGTITADMIEKIEVITNPSAKYDAEGTSGIINIILKKEEKKGTNGSISLNTGTPHNHSTGVSINHRTEKFNLFSQLGLGYHELPRYRFNINKNLADSTSVISNGVEYRNEQFYNFNLGSDYLINKRNMITLSGSLAYEGEDQPSETDFLATEGDQTRSSWKRTESTDASNPKYQYEFHYNKEFKDSKDHKLLFSAIGSFFGKDLSSEFTDEYTNSNSFDKQSTETNFREAKNTINLDYTRPIKKKLTIESGAQYLSQNVSNNYSVQDFENDIWVQNLDLTNQFDYRQNVLGIYTTGAYEYKKTGIKLGLRFESTDLKTELVNTSEINQRNFNNLFPSAHFSYKINDNLSFQTGYSRRIYRPRLWDLNPFFNIRNSFSIRTGNPDLLPELTDSYELSIIYILKKATLSFDLYQTSTSDVIERVSTFEENIRTYRPENIGTKKSPGAEFNLKYNPKRWFTLNGNTNFNYFTRRGEFDGQEFDFEGSRWSSKWTTSFKLKKDVDIEFTGNYQSSYKTIQGSTSDQFFIDLGLRKKILKNKGVINLAVRDLLASRIREQTVLQNDTYSYNRNYRGRFITVGFSYGFGKGEAMEYAGKRRH